MRNYDIFVGALFLVLAPLTSYGADGAPSTILFSEIAWMGSDADANDEWIELYNHGDTSVDVNDWVIVDENDEIIVVLKGSINGHSLALLKSTYGDDPDDISENVLTYSKRLSNDGKTLTLKVSTSSSSYVDRVIGGTNWENIGGKNLPNEPKLTPQRAMNEWVTGTPTPGAQNVEHNTSNQNTSQQNTNTSTGSNSTSKKSSGSSGGGNGGSSGNRVKVASEPLSLRVHAPVTAYVNQPVRFDAAPAGLGPTLRASLDYAWNFGDTYTGRGREITHTFQYPGEYIVVVEASYAKQRMVERHEVTVLPVALTLTRTETGELLLTNHSPQEVDLEGFTIVGTKPFTFPKFSFLKSDGSLIIGDDRIGSIDGPIALTDTKKVVVAMQNGAPSPTPLALRAPSRVPTAPIPVEPAASTRAGSITDDTSSNTIAEASTQNDAHVIQIGAQTATVNDAISSEGVFARLMRRIGGWFNN